MKKVSFEQLPPEVQVMFEDLRRHRVLIMRNGLPFAVVADVRNKDEEDLDLEESPEFWRMIQERRRETTSYSLEEVMVELADEEHRLQEKGESPTNEPVINPLQT
jgi:hypothetical protein